MGTIQDPQAPATKQDIARLEEKIDTLTKDGNATKQDIAKVEVRVTSLEEKVDVIIKDNITMKQGFKDVMHEFVKLELWKDEMMTAMRDWKDEMRYEFKIFAENMRHDFLGMHSHKVQNHENRIVRLEHHAKLAPM